MMLRRGRRWWFCGWWGAGWWCWAWWGGKDEVEGDDVNRKEEDRPLGAHFVPACAVKMLFNMSQEPLYTFYTEIYRKKAAPQDGPRTSQNARAHILCEHPQSKCTSTFHKSHFIRKFPGKMPRPKTAAQTLCEPAQSKRMSRFHKSHFMRKFKGKRPRPRMSPERSRTFCALIKHRPLLLT